MIYAKKKWGQNFLVDQNLLEKICNTCSLSKNDVVLEIGPGQGALTEKIIQKTKNLTLVEIDPGLFSSLKENKLFNDIKILNQDILTTNPDELTSNGQLVVIGNIPYNITSPIIFWLIDHKVHWKNSYLMVQKEYADRLIAKPKTKSYSRITVMTNLHFNIKRCFNISPNVFHPRPKVNSSFIEIKQKEVPLNLDLKKYSQIARLAFNQRRKMLRNSLSTLLNDKNSQEFDFTKRPEDLSVEEFIFLSKIL